MELDQFKDVNLVIDKANDIFIPRQFVSQGDYKGRTLTVQITNNGSIGEVPGLTLNLNWHNEASGLTDLTAFTILDKTNSIFRIEYPENMMTPGKVYASIQIIQDGKVTNLKQFELIVQKLAGQPVGIAENAEFSALVAVLADSNKFRTDIDNLSASKADKNYINDYLSKVTVVPETFTNLAAIQAKYPNGANGLMVAADNGHKYIWNNGSWVDAGIYQAAGIADDSIAPKYLTARAAPAFLAQNGSNQAVYERSKNILHLNDSLVISKGAFYAVRGDVALGTFGFIVFDQTSKNVAYANGDQLVDSMAILGTVYNGDLMLPGVNANDKDDVSPIIYIEQGGDPNLFTFDFSNMKIEYPSGSIYYGQKRYVWSRGSIDIIPSSSVYEQYLILAPSTGQFRLAFASDVPSYSLPDEVTLGYIDTSRKQFYSTKIDPNLCKTIPENKGLIDRQQTFAYSSGPAKIDFDNETIWLPALVMNDQRAETVITESKTVKLANVGGWLTYDKSNGSYQFDEGATPKRVGSDVLLMGWIDCQNNITNGVWGNNWVDVTLGSSRIGANLYYLGDSITVGFRNSDPSTACYPHRIYQRTGVPYTTDAITGSTVCGTESSSFVSRFKASDMASTEKLIIFGGHNDFHVSKPLGTIDSHDTTEFYGAYQKIIDSALANNPALRIYLIAPNWRIVDEGSPDAENRYDIATFKNGAGFTFLDYIQAIKNIGEKYHLPVLNLYEDWGVYQNNNKAWLVDGLHPNVSGQRWLSNIIQGFIENN